MAKKSIEIVVYGTEQICASCVGMPSSKETYEWLDAALSRKYPEQPFRLKYVDFQEPKENEDDNRFASRIIDEDLFYPVIVMDGDIVAEGNPRLKDIYEIMEAAGYTPVR